MLQHFTCFFLYTLRLLNKLLVSNFKNEGSNYTFIIKTFDCNYCIVVNVIFKLFFVLIYKY